MKPQDRENWRYSTGYGCPIDLEESVMFSLLPKTGEGGRVLDVGCGVGTVSLELQDRGFEVYGIDFSSVAIEKAREKGVNAIECDVDGNGIPFEDGYFDVVWAGDVVEHVFDPMFLLEEISRVLKTTGKVLISTPNDMNLYRRIYMFVTGKSPQSNVYRKYRQCKHHTVMSVELLEFMCITAGLSLHSIGSVIALPRLKWSRKYSNNRLLL